ncbi:MAG TPA: hypothetical protein VK421_04630 [Pyrinomonadaceae bacterium]|nr:hypothetical protein [Pyrinomonadaceae bacterium]
MGKTGSILIIAALLGWHGGADAHTLDGTAQAAGAARAGASRARANSARRAGARKRRKAAAVPSGAGRRRASPDGQPAHMAPQLEDIPPVKPPKKRLPPADKRNPAQ